MINSFKCIILRFDVKYNPKFMGKYRSKETEDVKYSVYLFSAKITKGVITLHLWTLNYSYRQTMNHTGAKLNFWRCTEFFKAAKSLPV